MLEEQTVVQEKKMFNHISYIRRNKNDPVSRHFNNADNICFGAEENMILYPIEQILDKGYAQRNKSLRLKRLYSPGWTVKEYIQTIDGFTPD